MAFFEVEFPRNIGFTSTGGSAWNTQINEGLSGFEQRNRNWAASRAKWQILLNSKPQAEFQLVYNFYLNVGGKADSFRFLFPLDYKAAGQFIATGNGVLTQFQLIKTYVSASRTYTRTIKKPIMSTVEDFQGNFLTDTVKMYVNGTPKTLNVDYTVDATTGIVSFTSAPSGAITADFQFHFPVRFDIDDMTNAQLEASDFAGGDGLITWSQINLIEERL